jgi:hypothetical protein
MLLADLHLHTSKSDGIFSPEELIAQAAHKQLAAIAITDHDTIDGIEEGLAAGKINSIEVVPGIEFNTDADNGELHILGYFIDHRNEKLVKFIKGLKSARYDRVKRMVEKLVDLGIRITFKEVLSMAEEKATLGRPHIARVLAKRGYVSTVKEAFDRYIGSGCPAYVERYKLKPVEAIGIIKESGGVPVLAHPGTLSRSEYIYECIEKGIQGIEVYHSKHTEHRTKELDRIAAEFSLIPTGGSDCHGECGDDGNILMGTVSVPYSTVELLRNRAVQNRKESIL